MGRVEVGMYYSPFSPLKMQNAGEVMAAGKNMWGLAESYNINLWRLELFRYLCGIKDDYMIREAMISDVEAMLAIYAPYVEQTAIFTSAARSLDAGMT